MQPIRNQLVFKPFMEGEQTKSGFYIPESCRKELDRGTIIAVGRGSKERPMHLVPGQIAFRVHNWGTPFEKDGEKFYLMDDTAILAVEKE